MRIAVMSDIHGNLPALEAVLARIGGLDADAVCCLGDVVGYGPFPNECLDLVRSRCSAVVKGNHDSGLIGETPTADFNQYGRRALAWTSTVITPEGLAWLRSLPVLTTVGPVTLVHASPADPGSWPYVLTMEDARGAFDALTTDVCCIGHTHVPVVIGEDLTINAFRKHARTGTEKARYLINVGSVGQPRDGDPRAAFGFLDLTRWSYELIRVEYDVTKTADAIRAAGLPEPLAQRLVRGH